MKKYFLFAASILMCAAFASCEPTDPNNDKPDTPDTPDTPEVPEKVEVQTAKDNLVAFFPMEDDAVVEVGDGVSYDSVSGAGQFVDGGFIGKGYSHSSGDNTAEAYLKLKLASSNAFNKLESMTFTAWVKLPAGKEAKGAVLSFNGTGVEAVWPSFVYLFDNAWKDEETGQDIQQFNGRIDFLTIDGKPAMWPNAQSAEYAKKDTWFQIARTYDASTGFWANYVNGVEINNGNFLVNDKPAGGIKAAFASDCNALYIGGWASRIEGKANDAWLNYFCGSIDEVRFFNKALSADDLLALYKEEYAIALDQ